MKPSLHHLIILLCFIVALILVVKNHPVQGDIPPPGYFVPNDNNKENSDVEIIDVSHKWLPVLSHYQSSKKLSDISETLGAGVCIGDINKDGWVDIVFMGGGGHTRHYGKKSWWHTAYGNRVLINNMGEYFIDQTNQMGLPQDTHGMGCALGDLDNDGYLDLFVSGLNENHLFKSIQGEKFVDVTADAGLQPIGWHTGISLVDFNLDGLLDIYLSGYVKFEKEVNKFEHNSGFSDKTNAFHAELFDAHPNKLYENLGDGKFKEVAKELGVNDPTGRTLGALWFDLNGDRWPDLITVNDVGSSNRVFLNNSGKIFKEDQELYKAFQVSGSHGIAIHSEDDDGLPSFVITKGKGAPPVYIKKRDSIATERSGYVDQASKKNIFSLKYLNRDDWGVATGDVNNDGFEDLVFASGSLLPDKDSEYVPQGQPNRLVLNQKGERYLDIDLGEFGYFNSFSSRSAVLADLNNDGQMEMIFTANNNPLQVLNFVNSRNYNWVKFQFDSDVSESLLYGASIEVHSGGRVLKRFWRPSFGFLSHGDSRIHIGLKDSQNVDLLIVRWPNGDSFELRDLQVNQVYLVGEKTVYEQDFRSKAFEVDVSEFSTIVQKYFIDIALQLPEDVYLSLYKDLWTSLDDQAKIYMLKQVVKKQPKHESSVISYALYEGSKELKLSALEAIEASESEFTLYSLLMLLRDQEESVACRASKAIENYYIEEEAVIHRKYIAVPELLRNLSLTFSEEKKVCFISALGHSESKRSLHALHNIVRNADESNPVRGEALKALASIKDSSSVVIISQLLVDETLPPALYSQALKTISKISGQHGQMALNAFFNANDDFSDLYRLKVLSELFELAPGSPIKVSQLRKQSNLVLSRIDVTSIKKPLDLISLINVYSRVDQSIPINLLTWIFSENAPLLPEDIISTLVEGNMAPRVLKLSKVISANLVQFINSLAILKPDEARWFLLNVVARNEIVQNPELLQSLNGIAFNLFIDVELERGSDLTKEKALVLSMCRLSNMWLEFELGESVLLGLEDGEAEFDIILQCMLRSPAINRVNPSVTYSKFVGLNVSDSFNRKVLLGLSKMNKEFAQNVLVKTLHILPKAQAIEAVKVIRYHDIEYDPVPLLRTHMLPTKTDVELEAFIYSVTASQRPSDAVSFLRKVSLR